MARVVILTAFAEYRGELDLSAAAGAEIRLLDALNTPSRLRFSAGQAEPSLVLTRPIRRARSSRVASPCGPRLVVRPGRVLAAYEEGEDGIEHDAVYERRQETRDERLLIHTAGDLRFEGSVRGGMQSLMTMKPARPFVACTRVMMLDLAAEAPPIMVPFMAVNLSLVESYGPAEGEGEGGGGRGSVRAGPLLPGSRPETRGLRRT